MTQSYDPSREGAQMSFDGRMSYGDYLALDHILTAQRPLSAAHDELLFIIQHQTSELWMKLALHEIGAARASIAAGALQPAFKMLARVSRIMEQLVHAWDVLATMTPPEYSAIRPYLAKSSGFQSWQYRCIEFSLGNKNAAMLQPHAHRADLLVLLDSLQQREAALNTEVAGLQRTLASMQAAGNSDQAAIENALDDAGLKPGDIDVVVLTGTGVAGIDLAEAGAVKAVLGERAESMPVVTVMSSTRVDGVAYSQTCRCSPAKL